MIEITIKNIKDVMPSLSETQGIQAMTLLNAAMQRFQISKNSFRTAAFLAQIAHESCELRHMQESWGPTPRQRSYDPPGALAEQLGNTESGDGFLYLGRGPIRIIGRTNYGLVSEELHVNLLDKPDLVSTPAYGFLASAWLWKSRGLNPLADVKPGNVASMKDLIEGKSFVEITRKIDASTTALKKRREYYRRALTTLVGTVLPRQTAGAGVAGISVS